MGNCNLCERLLSPLTFCFGSVASLGPNGTPDIERVPLLSAAVRAAPDLMAFMAPFGTKTIFEQKVPAGSRNAFTEYVMKRHSAESALRDFAAAWKVWLSQNTEELSDDDQEDVVDPAAADVYGLGGPDTSDTPVEEGAGGGA